MNWKPIKDYEHYEISDCGLVMNQDGVILKTKNDRYERIGLRKKGIQEWFSIHRLVALHFIDNPHNHPIVDHINGNKLDNRLENLRWITYSGNTRNSNHKRKHNLPRGVGKIGNRFKAEIKINGKSKYLGLFKTIEEASKIYEKEYEKIMSIF